MAPRDKTTPQTKYDFVYVNGSACGHLKQKINNALIYGQKCLSDMSLETQGNVDSKLYNSWELKMFF